MSRLSSSVNFFSLILPIALPYALWKLMLTKKLLVNDKITASFPTDILPKHQVKRCKQQK